MLLVALSASACGGSDDPGPQEPRASTAPATTSTTPSAPSSSAAPAATGPTLSLAHASVRIPDGWSKLDNSLYDQRDAGDDDSSSLISLGEIDAFGGQTDPDELGRSVIRTNPYPRDPQLLPVVVVDGVEMYHLAGKIHKNAYLEDFGAVVDDTIVSLSFTFSLEISPAERQQVVDSVLASYRWK
jgi:hypothetical protein